MSATFGERLRVTVFGQSHSEAMGAVVDGLPAGLRIDTEHLRAFLARRAPGQGPLTTARREPDAPEIIAGLADGVTCGAPLCILIRNTDARSRDYETLRRVVRPSHADYPAYVRFGGHNDIRGGGQFSGRLTAPLCAAGAVALQCLAARGVGVYAHIASIAGIKDAAVDPVSPDLPALAALAAKPLPVLDARAGEAMAQAVRDAAADGDSVGGVVESPACPPASASRSTTASRAGWPRCCSPSPPSRAWNSARASPPPRCAAAKTTMATRPPAAKSAR